MADLKLTPTDVVTENRCDATRSGSFGVDRCELVAGHSERHRANGVFWGVADLKDLTPEEMIVVVGSSLAEMFDSAGATNYVEFRVATAKHGMMTLTLQKESKPTPHDKRLEAEREIERLQARTCETCKHDQGTYESMNENYGRYCEVIPSGYVPLRFNGKPFSCTAHEPKEVTRG